MSSTILEMKNISKEFPGVKALDGVNFRVTKGEIHCLVGENGAGKSTLMKVLSGVYPYGEYSGDIFISGKVQQYNCISDSVKSGTAIIYQELALVPEMTVYENIFLGNEIHKNKIIDWNKTIKRSRELLEKVNLHVDPATKVKDLCIGKQQLIEIAKALSHDVKLLILDEPTAALNEDDSENLLLLLKTLKIKGVTSILISHKLKEVIEIADTVTVLRDGQTVCTLDAAREEVSQSVLVKYMVGREINNVYPDRENCIINDVVLEVVNWSALKRGNGKKILDNINFKVKKGEIVGIAGLMGSGRTEFALSMFGNSPDYEISGTMSVEGRKISFNNPEDAIKAGIAYVSEDRKGNGLILSQDVKQNIVLSNLHAIAKKGVVNPNAEIAVSNKYKDTLGIKTPSIEQKVNKLSGGNQQKVSLAKWLFVEPRVLILDEPTRGIDVGAKHEIYTIMNKLVADGMSIIMISSELPEILGMSDRIYVLSSGRITGEMPIDVSNQEKIMHLATN